VTKIVYSAGYGNNKPEDFIKRLKAAGITLVIDIRRRRCKSWNGKYRWHLAGMGKLVIDAGMGYVAAWISANLGKDLRLYRQWLYRHDRTGGHSIIDHLAWCIRHTYWQWERICFLCAEGNPFEPDGKTPRCHRVYVAEALVELLGDDWKVEHL